MEQLSCKIERFNRTLREQFLSCLKDEDKQTLDALNASLSSWINKYNNSPHRSINSSPAKVFEDSAQDIRYFTEGESELDKAFLNSEKRKVAKDSTIRLNKVLYDVPLEYIGKKVNVKYNPNNLDEIYIEKEDKTLVKIFKTDKVANSKVGRKKANYKFNFDKGE